MICPPVVRVAAYPWGKDPPTSPPYPEPIMLYLKLAMRLQKTESFLLWQTGKNVLPGVGDGGWGGGEGGGKN